MGIIQKRADELKPGDVVVLAQINDGRRGMILQSAAQEHYSGGIEAIYFHVAALDGMLPKVTEWGWEPEVELNVESPDLTPAQQHADELLKYAKIFFWQHCAGDRADAGDDGKLADLLDKIKPPEPPTLAEALEVLGQMRGAAHLNPSHIDIINAVDSLLDRARRAGVL